MSGRKASVMKTPIVARDSQGLTQDCCRRHQRPTALKRLIIAAKRCLGMVYGLENCILMT